MHRGGEEAAQDARNEIRRDTKRRAAAGNEHRIGETHSALVHEIGGGFGTTRTREGAE
jgi:hypothetical protein